MRILLAATQTIGGIRTYFRYTYGRPEFQDCVFQLVASDQSLASYLEKFLPPDRISLIPCALGHMSFLAQIRDQLRNERYDLLHSHGFTSGVLSTGAHLGFRVPHMMTAHDVFNYSQFSGLRGRVRKTVVGTAFRRLDAIHTVTEEATGNFLSFFPGLMADRIHSILHGIDTYAFTTSEATDLHHEHGIDHWTPLIGFFGRFMAQKGFRDLVDAIGIIQQRGLLSHMPKVITFGWGGYIREDYDYIRQCGLMDYFLQAPHTDNMPGALKGVDVVAMPSRWEACGLLAMEALVAGVPIVGTNCVGLNEVLSGSPAWIIDPRDSEALATALVEALKPGTKQVFEAYQPIARQRFDLERPARALRDLYDRIVMEHR